MKITTIEIGKIRIALAKIERLDSDTRRQAERRTANSLAANLICRDSIEIGHSDDGSPFIPGLDAHISVSHSVGIAAVAISPDRPIGIDIEENRQRQLENVAPRILSAAELAYYQSIDFGLLRAWTLKEALCKASRNLRADFRTDIVLPLSEDEKKATVAAADGRASDFQILACRPVDIDGCQAWISAVTYSLVP